MSASEDIMEDSPFEAGLLSVVLVPLGAILCLIMAISLVLAWPFLPIGIYLHKRKENRRQALEKIRHMSHVERPQPDPAIYR